MAILSRTLEEGPTGDRAPATPAVEVAGLTLAYEGHLVLEGVDLRVEAGEVVAIVGPSGSGKSSLLRAIAGFLEPAGGTIDIGGELVAGPDRNLPPEARRIGFVFQHYALFPHMTVHENVAYPWRIRGLAKQERTERADALLARVGLAGLGSRRPSSLSGGQQQRVALARSLAGDPRLLLLDEPLSSVDAARRDDLQSLILDVARSQRLTTLVTTHDQREAATLADRVVVLGTGRIAQVAPPAELYQRPANAFVARFMGALNVFDARVLRSDQDRVRLTVAATKGELVVRSLGGNDLAAREGEVVTAVFRPETIRLVAPGTGDQDGRVMRVALVDGRSEVRVEVGGTALRVFEDGLSAREAGDLVGVVLEGCLLLRDDVSRPRGPQA